MIKKVVLLVLIISLIGFVSAEEETGPVLDCVAVAENEVVEGDHVTLSYSDDVIEILVGGSEGTIYLRGGDIILEGDSIITKDVDEGLLKAEAVTLKPDRDSVFHLQAKRDKGYEEFKEFDSDDYGEALVDIGVTLYTYGVFGDKLNFLLGDDFFLTYVYSNAKVEGLRGICQLTEAKSECEDGLDNDGDGYVDSVGVCSDGRKCFCDYDGDGRPSDGEFGGPYYCSEEYTGVDTLTYYCVEDGSIEESSCEDYAYEDENCLYGESESSDYAETYPCLDANFGLMLADCELEGGCENGELEGDLIEEEKVCEETYESGTVACIDKFDCSVGQACDVDGVCVSLEALVEERDLLSCEEQSDCSFGEECIDNYCQEQAVSGITPDNPFFGWMETGVDGIRAAIGDEETQLKLIEEELAENRKMEERAKEGYISDERSEKLQAKGLNNIVKGTEKAAGILAEKMEENPDNPGLQNAFRKVSSHTSVASEEIEKIKGNRPDLSKTLEQAQDRVSNVMEKVENVEGLPKGLKENFGEATLGMQKKKGNILESGKFGKKEGEKSTEPRVVQKLSEQVKADGVSTSKVAQQFKESGQEKASGFVSDKVEDSSQRKKFGQTEQEKLGFKKSESEPSGSSESRFTKSEGSGEEKSFQKFNEEKKAESSDGGKKSLKDKSKSETKETDSSKPAKEKPEKKKKPPLPTGQVVAENVKDTGRNFFSFLFFNDRYDK